MLVPGIHSDSKIKLQEEVLYKKQESLSDWRKFGILFVGVQSLLLELLSLWSSQFCFDCVGIQESCLGFFVGTEEKQSDSSEHTFDNGAVSSGHTHTQKGEVRWCSGG